MKTFTQLGLFFSLLISFTSYSQAALLLEPVVGYSVGTFNSEINGPLNSSIKEDDALKGTSYGGRIGYQNLGFQVGADYLASNMSFDDRDLKTEEWAGFVGFEFPILVRVYAGYVFSGNGSLEASSGSDIKLKGGTGPKIGVGFTLLPFLDINLEYRRITYENKDFGAGVDQDTDYSATMLAFSLPFTL